ANLLGRFALGKEAAHKNLYPVHKEVRLLAYLLYHRHQPHSRDSLAEVFWPNCDPLASRGSLRVALTHTRRILSGIESDSARILQTDRELVRIDASACELDLDRFWALIRRAKIETDAGEAFKLLQSAVDEYKGPLLPLFDDDWIVPERRRLE